MAESKLFKDHATAASMRTTTTPAPAPSPSSAKAKAKGKAKSKARSKRLSKATNTIDPSIQATSFNGRQTCFIDDLLLLIASVCRQTPPQKVEACKDDIGKLLRTGILFGLKDNRDKFAVALDEKETRGTEGTKVFSKYSGPEA
eukprot:7501966-Alexandrium_andersonii.AAC.1